MSLQNINTGRLILIPITLEIANTLLEGRRKEIDKMGIHCDAKWPTDDTMDILPIMKRSLEESKLPTGFETWMIVDKNDKRIIGDIGFHGRPNEKGEVEVGFGLVENEREKGIGSEALNAIIYWLHFQESVKVIKAECLIDNKPSACILEKAGFIKVNRDSELIYWELKNTRYQEPDI